MLQKRKVALGNDNTDLCFWKQIPYFPEEGKTDHHIANGVPSHQEYPVKRRFSRDHRKYMFSPESRENILRQSSSASSFHPFQHLQPSVR